MSLDELIHGLYFDDDAFVYDEVRDVVAENNAVIQHLESCLVDVFDFRFGKFMCERFVINVFEKTRAQDLMDGDGATNNGSCKWIIFPKIFVKVSTHVLHVTPV
jgi:hypothetical protein